MVSNEKEVTFRTEIGKNFFLKKGKLDFKLESPGRVDISVRDVRCKDELRGFVLWAESKEEESKDGDNSGLIADFIQLLLTIGKEHLHEQFVPPNLLCAFDKKKITFLPYSVAKKFFSEGIINWDEIEQAASARPKRKKPEEAKEFQRLLKYEQETKIIESNMTVPLRFEEDKNELEEFIEKNLREGIGEIQKIQITEANFVKIYQNWAGSVKNQIRFKWDEKRDEQGVFGGDFYLADLLSDEIKNSTLEAFQGLRVTLVTNPNDARGSYYKVALLMPSDGLVLEGAYEDVRFKDGGHAHKEFWNLYARPPAEKLWDLLIDRRDLLVPPNVRELKGAFYTPEIWVKKSQEYIARELGDDWQKKYYVWDCCAGSGNLLKGLKNKGKIFASTLDFADVLIMRNRATKPASDPKNPKKEVAAELNLNKAQIFQFDFLKDEFEDEKVEGNKAPGRKSKLPKALQDIINDPEKRKKLVIYINPPYAEAASSKTRTRSRTEESKNKTGVATSTRAYNDYKDIIGEATNELFAQFLIRIYDKMKGCIIADFSTLKVLLGQNFELFHKVFKAKLCQLFLVDARTFDHINGTGYPIGFHIWRTAEEEPFTQIAADVYENDGTLQKDKKVIDCPDGLPRLSQWVNKGGEYESKGKAIGLITKYPPDFQNQRMVSILSEKQARACLNITAENLTPVSVYFAVRHCRKEWWLINRDQIFAPLKNDWKDDLEFQSDCLAYTLFHDNNKIRFRICRVNHWIPFQADGDEEDGVGSDGFSSDFMWKFINGELTEEEVIPQVKNYQELDLKDRPQCQEKPQFYYNGTHKIEFSKEARAVFSAGRELWRYYHKRIHEQFGEEQEEERNASLDDIKRYFQGETTNEDGTKRMNNRRLENNASLGEEYVKYAELLATLLDSLKNLADKKITPKALKYGFLLR